MPATSLRSAAPQTLEHPAFSLEGLSEKFRRLTIEDRIRFAHDWTVENTNGTLALSSSFGVQSALLLQFAKSSKLDIPVISVDIADEKYDGQREYRQKLTRTLNLDLHVFPASDDAHKVPAMDDGLRALGIAATISGIRAAQTKTRAQKKFVEWNERNNTVTFHPLLDWPDAKTDFYLSALPEDIRHPAYKPGVKSKGGFLLREGEEKTECGLHL